MTEDIKFKSTAVGIGPTTPAAHLHIVGTVCNDEESFCLSDVVTEDGESLTKHLLQFEGQRVEIMVNVLEPQHCEQHPNAMTYKGDCVECIAYGRAVITTIEQRRHKP